jgi:hypothetical protein
MIGKSGRYLVWTIYLFFLIVLFEGSARLALSHPEVSSLLVVNDDLSWRREWVSRHKDRGTEIYYKFDIHDTTKGWLSKPNLRNMRVFDDKVLNTNSRGFRGEKDYLYVKDRQQLRIIILGDSFTFGDEVSDHETYAHYLQQLIPHAEIINMGVHGYGHDQMLVLLKEIGVKFEPDIVILGFIHGDMHRNMLNFRDYAKPKYVLDDDNLVLTGHPVPHPEEILKSDWARPRVFDIGSIIRYQWKIYSGTYQQEMEEITGAILAEMVRVTENIEAIPILAYLGVGAEITSKAELTENEVWFFSVCQKINNANCFSTRPVFTEELEKGIEFNTLGHWGPAGHQAVARAIERYLVEDGYIYH